MGEINYKYLRKEIKNSTWRRSVAQGQENNVKLIISESTRKLKRTNVIFLGRGLLTLDKLPKLKLYSTIFILSKRHSPFVVNYYSEFIYIITTIY